MPLDFRPDADPTTPGIITDCNNLIPTIKGYRSGYTAATAGIDALAAACLGTAAVRKMDDTTRMFAGTTTKLWELNGTGWDDVSRAVGGAYATATARWRFAQQGDRTFAVNTYDTPQTSTSGAFANLAAMPKAKYICTSGQFILIAGTNEGTYGDDPIRWWCSAISNYADWTPAIATQCATAQVTDTPGGISGLRTLGSAVVIYKQRSMYLLEYQGPPLVWTSRLCSIDVGAVGHDAVIALPYEHYFIGFEDIYRFDGSVPQPIGAGIKEWFFNRVDKAYYHKIQGLYDRYRSTLYWFYPTAALGTGALTEYLAYNLLTQKWGFGTLTVEGTTEYITASLTYDQLWLGLTFATVPDVSFDSLADANRGVYPSVFNSSHVLCTLSGNATDSRLVTGYVGEPGQITKVARVQPRYLTKPTAATMTPKWSFLLGSTDTAGSAVTQGTLGRFDHLRGAKWHKFQFDFTGNHEETAIDIVAKPGGRE